MIKKLNEKIKLYKNKEIKLSKNENKRYKDSSRSMLVRIMHCNPYFQMTLVGENKIKDK